jgi:bifunctional enzyme CysN/CysC
LICCAAFVAPNPDSREHALSVIGKDNCVIVYLNPPMAVCQQRDPSGIYAAAEATGSAEVPGITFAYPKPEHVDLELDTNTLTVEDCLDQVIELMQGKGIISGR